MASPEDYVGKEFGCFKILKQIGHGAEAEVYLCSDSRSHRGYVLRLAISDDALWDGEPLLPPVNRSLEVKNAEGSWHAKQAYEKTLEQRLKDKKKAGNKGFFGSLLKSRKANDEIEFQFRVPTVYGVRDLQYLIPLSDAFELRDCLSVERLLSIAPPDDLNLFELWEDIALSLLTDTHALVCNELPIAQWRSRWESVAFGPILKAAIGRYMKAGSLSVDAQREVLSRLPEKGDGRAELARGLLLRLIGAVTRGRCLMDVALRTVRSRYFRENLAWAELEQLVAAYQVLANFTHGTDNSTGILQAFLSEVSKPVYEPSEDPEEFRLNTTPISTDGYTLFLQEFAGQEQPELPTVHVSKGE